VDSSSWRLNESVFHWVDGGTICALPVFEDKVEGNCAIVATDAHKGILKVVYIGESEFIGKKIWVSITRLSVYTAVSW
jgi:hypothetical protein